MPSLIMLEVAPLTLLKFNGWKELLISSILSTHTAVLSLMGLTHGLSLWTFLFITFDAQQAHWLNLIN